MAGRLVVQVRAALLALDCGLSKQLCTLGYTALKNSKSAKVLSYRLNKLKTNNNNKKTRAAEPRKLVHFIFFQSGKKYE